MRSLGKKPNFWPSQRLKKLTDALSCMHKGPKCIQSLWDHPKKFLLCKSTKKARYVRSLGKKPHFWPSQRLKKVLLTAQGCTRLHTGPIIMQIPRGYQKKSLLCRKARYVRSLGKTQFLAFPVPKKANWHSQLHAQRSQMHSIPLGPSKKNSFCAKAQRRRDMCDP